MNIEGRKGKGMIIKIGSYEFDSVKIEAEAPKEEPARQYYFIKICRSMLKAKFEQDVALGSALKRYGEENLEMMEKNGWYGTFHIQTFGCQMNSRDSEKLDAVLRACGFYETDTEQADFVLYNTCTVRENANLKVYGRLGVLNTLKKKNPDMTLSLIHI